MIKTLALLVALTSVAAASPPPALMNACGECHMVYPAAMLPARSWVAILGGLNDHFGESADLPADQKAAIVAYLTDHAADSPNLTPKERHYLSEATPDETPKRITATPWWRQMHADYNFEASKHPEVKSPANCRGCHGPQFE